MDEPEHRRLRSLVAQAFRQKTLAHWDQDLVLSVVDEMIDRFADRSEAELVREFTYQHPARVIAEGLGLPREDHPFFHPRALAAINVSVRPDEGIAASTELRDYFEGIVEERRRNPGTGIISELVQAELDGERLGDKAFVSTQGAGHAVEIQCVQNGRTVSINYSAGNAADTAPKVADLEAIAHKVSDSM